MINERKYDITLLLLRLTFGLTMLVNHGWPKLMKLMGDEPIKFLDFMGMGPTIALMLAVFAEVFCSLLLMLGWLTRLACIPLIFTMLVAIFKVHWGDPFSDLEGAILYLIVYLCIFIAGPGWYSLDNAKSQM
jgi:putative oxidoreductase